jgi:hypothetical protein
MAAMDKMNQMFAEHCWLPGIGLKEAQTDARRICGEVSENAEWGPKLALQCLLKFNTQFSARLR